MFDDINVNHFNEEESKYFYHILIQNMIRIAILFCTCIIFGYLFIFYLILPTTISPKMRFLVFFSPQYSRRVLPPSMGIEAPVMYELRGEHKNAARSPNSPGLPGRPTGISLENSSKY